MVKVKAISTPIKPIKPKSAKKSAIVKKPKAKAVSAVVKKPVKDKLRGVSLSDLANLSSDRNQLDAITIGDRKQCDRILGNIVCDGSQICYICLSKLIPHEGVFNQYCMSDPNTLWDKTKNDSIISKRSFYPECEHVIPCRSLSDKTNPWQMNYMFLGIYKRMFDVIGIPALGTTSIVTYATTIGPLQYLDITSPNIHKLEYFLKIFLRMNYEWSHKICNGIKNNDEFLYFDNLLLSYIVNNPNILKYLDKLFNNPKNYYRRIEQELSNMIHPANKATNHINLNSINYYTNLAQLKTNAFNSIHDRIDFIRIQLSYALKLFPPPEEGFKKFKINTITSSVQSIIQGGGGTSFIQKLYEKMMTFKKQIKILIPLFENINQFILSVDNDIFNNIEIPDDYDTFLNLMQNIYKTIFLTMLRIKIKNLKYEGEDKYLLEMLELLPKLYKYIDKKITKLHMDDYFFQDVIKVFNNITKLDILYYNILNFSRHLLLLEKNMTQYEKNHHIYEYIKKLEYTASYELLIKLLNFQFTKEHQHIFDRIKGEIAEFDEIRIKTEYIKILKLNNSKIPSKYDEMLDDIYEKTSKDTIKENLVIIFYFKEIVKQILYKEDIEREFYCMGHIYFNLCIAYGLLYKKKVNLKKNSLSVIQEEKSSQVN